MMTERSTVVGVFTDRQQADRAIADLRRAGFRDDQIGYAMRRDDGAPRISSPPPETHAEAGVATGAITGAALGGLAGALAAGLIPGFGPFLAAGILTATAGG